MMNLEYRFMIFIVILDVFGTVEYKLVHPYLSLLEWETEFINDYLNDQFPIRIGNNNETCKQLFKAFNTEPPNTYSDDIVEKVECNGKLVDIPRIIILDEHMQYRGMEVSVTPVYCRCNHPAETKLKNGQFYFVSYRNSTAYYRISAYGENDWFIQSYWKRVPVDDKTESKFDISEMP